MLVVGCDFAVKFLIFVRPQNLSKCGVILLQALTDTKVTYSFALYPPDKRIKREKQGGL